LEHQEETLAHPREQITVYSFAGLAPLVVCPISASSWAEYTGKHKKIERKSSAPKQGPIKSDRKTVIRKSNIEH